MHRSMVIIRRFHAAGGAAQQAAAAASAASIPSFSRALFMGRIAAESVTPFPVDAALTSDSRELLGSIVEPTRKFMETGIDSAEMDRTSHIPDEALGALKGFGTYGLQAPEEFEGAGLGSVGYGRVMEEMGAGDLGVGIVIGAHQSIGYKGIMLYGTPEQKAKYLPDLASGRKTAAFALTEPGAGSDAAGLKTRATLSADGKHYLLNGSKIWITNGPTADVMTVFAKTDSTDPKTGAKKDAIIALIVERAFGGLTHGAPEKKMGLNCSPTSEVFFENCPVPVENRLLGVGDGFKVAMGILNSGRFSLGATLTGTMKAALRGSVAHANTRTQFGKKLREFPVIRDKLAGMAARIYATESLAYMLAANMDRGMADYQIEAACSKVAGSENAWHCVDEAIQIHGGAGFMRSLPWERVLRDLRVYRIFEGSNEILRQMVGNAGMQSLAKELEAAGGAAPAAPATVDWLPKELELPSVVLAAGATAFGEASRELVVKHGAKGLAAAQLHLARAADVVSDLTALAAAASRAAAALRAGTPAAKHEVALANVFASEARHRIEANVRAMGSPAQAQVDAYRSVVAEATLDAGGYVPPHPTGVN